MGHLKMERWDKEGRTILAFRGIIDEESDFHQALTDLRPAISINLSGIKLINSLGVREWTKFIQEIPLDREITLEECSIRMVDQMKNVARFSGRGEVVSFYAPYFCSKCRASTNVLLKASDLPRSAPPRAPQRSCPACETPMEFDDVEEEYFTFLA